MIYLFEKTEITNERILVYKTEDITHDNEKRLGAAQNQKGVYKILKGCGYKRTPELEKFVESIREN